MIRISQFRRLLLDEEIPLRQSKLFVSPACHKGNAGQSQASTQVGAQPGGSAISGTGNSATSSSSTSTKTLGIASTDNAGATFARNAIKGGGGGGRNDGGSKIIDQGGTDLSGTTADVQLGDGATINVTDGGAQQAALNALATALSQSNAALTAQANNPATTSQTGTTPAPVTVPGALVPSATTDAGGSKTPSAVSAFFNLSKWQMAAAICAVIGTLYLIFSRHRRKNA